MGGDLWHCERCPRLVATLARWRIYSFNAHTFGFEAHDTLCTACGDEEHTRFKPTLAPDEWAVKAVQEILDLHSGEPVTVRWLGWDEHRWNVMIRAAACDLVPPEELAMMTSNPSKTPPPLTQDDAPASAEALFPPPPGVARDPVGHNRAALNLPTPDHSQRDPRHGNPFQGGRATT